MYKFFNRSEDISDETGKPRKKMKKIIAIACAVALMGTSIPLFSMSVGAQESIYAKTTADVNLRKGTGTQYGVLKVISNNSTVTVTDKSNSGWLKVQLSDGTVGYCSADYLDIITDAKVNTYLNIRRGAGTNYSVIKTLAPGVKLDIVKFYGDSWAQVIAEDGTKGYVSTDYVTYLSSASQTSKPALTNTNNSNSTQAANNSTNTASSTVTVSISNTTATIGVGKNLALTAKTNSGGTFTWTSSDKNIATVTSKGVVTGVKAGTVTITATDSKSKKSVKCTVKVVKETLSSITLPASSKTLTKGETYTIKPTTVPSGGAVAYTTSNSSIVTVTASGTVKAVGIGAANVTVYDPAGTVKATMKFTVKELPKLTLSASSASLKLGTNYIIKATTSDNSAVTWSSSDTNVAAVRNGVVSGLKAGSAVITATDSTGKVKATCNVTVTSVSGGSISLSRYSASTTAGKTIYIEGYSPNYAEWGTSDSNIATVCNGFILTKNPGKVGITYTDTTGSRRLCVVTVYEADPIKFTYSSPNSAVLNSEVKLTAITDKTRTAVKFIVEIDGKNLSVNATEKKAEGNTYVWTGKFKPTVAGTLKYKAYSYKNNQWSTSSDGTSDVYVTSKTNPTATGLERLRASDEVIQFIGDKEGFVPVVTYDTLANNLPTLGHGYVVWEGQCFYDNITRGEGYALLVKAVNDENYAREVNNMLLNNNIRFNQQQFDALVSFSYNLGTGWTGSSDIKNILLNSYGTVSNGSSMTGIVNANGGLNLRQSYTTSSSVIKVLADGEKVTLVSTQKYNSVWYKVKTSDGTVGYCSGTYLNLVSGSTTTGRDLRYVNRNALINELLAYHHACGVCYYGLLYRRCDELEMFFYGDYAPDGYKDKYNFPSPYCLSF